MTKSYLTYQGDCLKELNNLEAESVDLCYLDPPFFTQRKHAMGSRDGLKSFSFDDFWSSQQEYADFLFERISKVRHCLKSSGSVFFHCDKSASHIARMVLDTIFGPENFQSEIIWYFRRWSNSKRGLLPAHQTIFFYSKTANFKFNPTLQEYSPTTNIDQILQKRGRDARNKSVYATDKMGEIVMGGVKQGVPLSDVWEMPFLNPKAKERVGYPTQKPISLLSRIISLTTDPDDIVLDPFCGSGTTLVAAQQMQRRSIGIDSSPDAIALAKQRLKNPVVTKSALLENGKESYRQHDKFAESHLATVDYTPVQRNKGIDGLLKKQLDGLPVFVRVQRPEETIGEAASKLLHAIRTKGACVPLLVRTHQDLFEQDDVSNVRVIAATSLLLEEELCAETIV